MNVNRFDWQTDANAHRTFIVATDGVFYAGITAIDFDACVVESVRFKGEKRSADGKYTLLEADRTPDGNPVIDRCPFRLVSDEKRASGIRVITVEWTATPPKCVAKMPPSIRARLDVDA